MRSSSTVGSRISDANLTVRLPVAGLQHVLVQVDRGNVKVTDATRAQVVASGAAKLDLGR
jgi:hypothetical protein